MGDAIPLSRFKGVIGGESELPLCFATFAFKSRPVRQDIIDSIFKLSATTKKDSAESFLNYISIKYSCGFPCSSLSDA